MSLQDYRMQTHHNISRKTKFMKKFKFLKYLVYRHLMTHYTPPVNGKSIGQLEAEKQMFKVLSLLHSLQYHCITQYHAYMLVIQVIMLIGQYHSVHLYATMI